MNDDLPSRKSLRLKDYDYSGNGAYFVTICTKDKKCILSRIESVGSDAHIAPQATTHAPGTRNPVGSDAHIAPQIIRHAAGTRYPVGSDAHIAPYGRK